MSILQNWNRSTTFYPGVKNGGTFLRILPPLPFRQIVSFSGKGAMKTDISWCKQAYPKG